MHGVGYYMWPDLQQHTTYAHNGKESPSSPTNSSINKLTNYHNTTVKSWLVCFFWGLFLRLIRCPQVLRCSLNATGQLVQVATLLKHHLTHLWCRPWICPYFVKFWEQWSYILCHFTLKLLSFAVTRYFVATHHPTFSTPI